MSPLELIKASVNKHGELHLGKEHTELLLAWLLACENYEKQTQVLFGDVCEAFKPLGVLLSDIEKDNANE